jgi:hypothetical protein
MTTTSPCRRVPIAAALAVISATAIAGLPTARAATTASRDHSSYPVVAYSVGRTINIANSWRPTYRHSVARFPEQFPEIEDVQLSPQGNQIAVLAGHDSPTLSKVRDELVVMNLDGSAKRVVALAKLNHDGLSSIADFSWAANGNHVYLYGEVGAGGSFQSQLLKVPVWHRGAPTRLPNSSSPTVDSANEVSVSPNGKWAAVVTFTTPPPGQSTDMTTLQILNLKTGTLGPVVLTREDLDEPTWNSLDSCLALTQFNRDSSNGDLESSRILVYCRTDNSVVAAFPRTATGTEIHHPAWNGPRVWASLGQPAKDDLFQRFHHGDLYYSVPTPQGDIFYKRVQATSTKHVDEENPSFAPVDTIAPLPATFRSTRIRHHRVLVRWRNSPSHDYSHVVLDRRPAGAPIAADTRLYSGRHRSLLDHRLTPGAKYIYTITAYDGAGNAAPPRQEVVRVTG